jgi:hypothetical protein
MGDSTQHFIGPETPGVPANWNDEQGAFRSFRDKDGKILRQGTRFRVFEYDQDDAGNLSNPREIKLGDDIADIEWRVHLANRKASFYVFDGQRGADDLYVARSKLPPTEHIKDDPDRTNLRNADVPESERTERLDIDPGEQLLSQRQRGPIELSNTKSHIPIKSLGTLLDDNGRLIVLGGYGESNSTAKPPRKIDEYASNDTWFDDASDGTVKARIRLRDGTTSFDADPAWLFVGPPDFAPAAGNVVSLHDTLWDTAVREVEFPSPTPATPMLQNLLAQKAAWEASGKKNLSGFLPSFLNDIYPLIRRALAARDSHVSGIANPNYHKTMLDWAKLAKRDGEGAADAAELRQYIFGFLRDPDADINDVKWDKMPRGLGDDYTALDNDAPTARSFLSLTRIQYALMREWASGNFISDWPGSEPLPKNSPDPTPDELDRAAAENSVGGPFFPGIDVSWLIREKNLFSEPLRLKVPPQPNFGALEYRPGFFSQQMALPWQADFYDCHKERHEDPDGNEFYFMWWTAQRPDDVFPSGGTSSRARWVRLFDEHAKDPADPDALDNLERFNQMQQNWPKLKFLSVQKDGHFEEEPDFNAT